MLAPMEVPERPIRLEKRIRVLFQVFDEIDDLCREIHRQLGKLVFFHKNESLSSDYINYESMLLKCQ